MNGLLLTTQQALQLLLSGDAELWSIVMLSFSVSLKAILITTPFALSVAFALNHGNFPGRRIILAFFNSLLSVPTVVIGLFLYVMLTRQGPFGDLRLLFTQSAMVIGQMILCFPVLVALGYAAIQASDRRVWETARTLGAPTWFSILTVFYEVRFGLLAAVLTGFGRIISEVGISMMAEAISRLSTLSAIGWPCQRREALHPAPRPPSASSHREALPLDAATPP